LLVSALTGLKTTRAACAHAITRSYRFYSYRFYSYGDSSLLLLQPAK
jgi:S-adenosylmethionine:tRNA-ribosyltransferase-isomerase (queuine synthetase)